MNKFIFSATLVIGMAKAHEQQNQPSKKNDAFKREFIAFYLTACQEKYPYQEYPRLRDKDGGCGLTHLYNISISKDTMPGVKSLTMDTNIKKFKEIQEALKNMDQNDIYDAYVHLMKAIEEKNNKSKGAWGSAVYFKMDECTQCKDEYGFGSVTCTTFISEDEWKCAVLEWWEKYQNKKEQQTVAASEKPQEVAVHQEQK